MPEFSGGGSGGSRINAFVFSATSGGDLGECEMGWILMVMMVLRELITINSHILDRSPVDLQLLFR